MSQGQHRPSPRNTAPTRPAILKRLVAVPLVMALMSGVAWAYWTASSVPGGGGASAATTVNQGATPTASVAGTAVTISWAASTLSNGSPVAGYVVKRYDVATLSSQTILSACTGTVTATTCTENSVPTGQWVYSVTPMFATNWRGAESLRSNAVTTDATPPVSAISMAVLTGNALKTGNTIFYRGAGAGSFRLTNAVSDSGTGPASSATAVLTGTSTGWTAHTPSTVSTPTGGPYVSNPFSWTAGAASSPTEVVTARDVAGNSATTTLSFVNDSTPPGPDTITYTAGYQPGRSVVVSFTTGTDSGSGIATRQLQRSFAPLTAGSCGSFSSFADLGPANPTSPYTDSQVTNGICYRYRYVVTDLLGNQDIATSPNVTRVDYAGAVNTTPGLLSQWRLGESTISSDSFTGAAGDLLTSHIGEIGATWLYQQGSSNTERISSENRARRNGAGYAILYTTAIPPSPDYSVEADLFVKSTLAGDMAGVIGRLDTFTNTFYMARWEQANTSWNLVRYSGNVATTLSRVTGLPTLTVGATYRVRLAMTGTALKLYVNGVLTVSASDTTLAAVGWAGIMDGDRNGTAVKDDSAGLHFDNFQVTPTTYPRAADSKGSNTGDYVNGPTLGAAGALAGDANTAAQFDGVNDYVQAVGTTGLPVGASLRSVEMWFKTTSAAQQVLFDYGARANDHEFGLWLNRGGTSMTAWGYGPNDKTFALPSAVNDGTWHQVVKTYDGTSITLYIDGVALPSQAAPRTTTMDSYGFTIGAVIVPGDINSGYYFNGSLDEVSFYTTVLNQTTVTNHYQLGSSPASDVTGPTGGSVDAGSLVGTGSSYATSTVLSLNLATGTDPSGVATTGAQLLRATATLTSGGTADGTCNAYGSYTLVSGGTDPATPKSDIVADQACYSYRYVVADTLGNSTTYTSPDIKVDLAAPSAPTLTFGTFTNTYWSSGSTVFYRSAAASGSFTTAASSTDTKSGIAGYGFPALGTNWTSTPGATGVNTYSWSGTPAAPGTKSVTATNNATGTSAGTSSFTLTADNSAPTAGTVSYLNGTTTGTSVSVSFTTGTDGGSGIGTRLLQRAAATLTGSTCGAFGVFTTVTNGTNPTTSPLVDTTVVTGNCYMYRYVVPDNVGNQDTAVSASVVKAWLSYLATINGEASLLSYWRLGETGTSSDSFTGTAGATLQSRAGEIGATWTKHAISGTTDAVVTNAGRIRKNGTTSGALYYSSAVPASADYKVEADVYVATSVSNDLIGIVGRLDPAIANGTFYAAVYDRSSQMWTLGSIVNGTSSVLGQSSAQPLMAGATYRLALDMTGPTIRLLVDGVQQVSVVNAAITTPGRGGVLTGFGAASTTVTDTTGMHLDNFTLVPPLTDAKGTNNGDYLNGPTLGVAGAIVGDSNTAALFDGVNDYGTVLRQISDSFSIEFWFKSTQLFGTTCTSWWQGAGLVDAEVNGSANDFGVSLCEGKVVAGVGPSPDVSIVSPGGYGDGLWHHVVFARIRTSGALQLYVDGVLVGSATGSTVSLTSPANINFGRIQTGTYYFSGSLDEVAIYSAALPQAAVTAHYNAGK